MKIRKNYIFGLFLFDLVFEKITVQVLFERLNINNSQKPFITTTERQIHRKLCVVFANPRNARHKQHHTLYTVFTYPGASEGPVFQYTKAMNTSDKNLI